MRPGPTPSALLFYVKQEPRETATGALTVKCNQSGQDFHLSCIYRLGFIERPGFSTDSVTWKVPLAKEQVESALKQLRQASVPACPDFPGGCDGTIYELGLGGYMGRAVYRWWGSPPPRWEVLGSVVITVLAWADAPAALTKKRRT